MIKKIFKFINKKSIRGNEKTDITLEQLEKKQKEGAIIIDVRSPQEYKEGHIQGAISIPEYEINKEIYQTLKNKEEEIVLYCSSGFRSRKALKKLQKMGYVNVYNLII